MSVICPVASLGLALLYPIFVAAGVSDVTILWPNDEKTVKRGMKANRAYRIEQE